MALGEDIDGEKFILKANSFNFSLAVQLSRLFHLFKHGLAWVTRKLWLAVNILLKFIQISKDAINLPDKGQVRSRFCSRT